MSDHDGESFTPLETQTPGDSDNYVYGLKRWLVTLSVTLVMFLTLLDTTIIVTVQLPHRSN
jgi:hypothetical protein